MSDALPAAIPVTTLQCLVMSFHANRSAKVTLIARAAGQAIFTCPESVPALAATSLCTSHTTNLSKLPCAPPPLRLRRAASTPPVAADAPSPSVVGGEILSSPRSMRSSALVGVVIS
eukprot:6188066-Pleurochrysis_carterae.AAC.1